jgi:hypothetical protein
MIPPMAVLQWKKCQTVSHDCIACIQTGFVPSASPPASCSISNPLSHQATVMHVPLPSPIPTTAALTLVDAKECLERRREIRKPRRRLLPHLGRIVVVVLIIVVLRGLAGPRPPVGIILASAAASGIICGPRLSATPSVVVTPLVLVVHVGAVIMRRVGLEGGVSEGGEGKSWPRHKCRQETVKLETTYAMVLEVVVVLAVVSALEHLLLHHQGLLLCLSPLAVFLCFPLLRGHGHLDVGVHGLHLGQV